ncbi:transmembrane protein 126A [Cricetulus griseus]
MAASKPQACSEFGDTGVLLKEAREAPQDIKMAIYTYGQLIPSLGDAKFRPMISEIIEKQLEYYKKPSKMENHKESAIKDDLISNIISRKVKQLPESERNLLEYGSAYVGLNAGFSGLIANSLFRRILHVTQARLASSLPMAVMPFLTATLTYVNFLSYPLSTGDLNCETCAMTRGALVGFGMGGVYPILLAIPMNGGLAARYESSPLPRRGNILNYWITVSKPVCRKMVFPILLQTVFAAYLGSRQYRLLIKALQLPEPGLENSLI